MDFFKIKRSSPLLVTLQRIYEEAHQASVHAIVLETRNEKAEALQAWEATLRKISLGLATVTDTPQSSNEVDVMTSIMNIEKQCHDRIIYLERGWTNTHPYSSYSSNSHQSSFDLSSNNVSSPTKESPNHRSSHSMDIKRSSEDGKRSPYKSAVSSHTRSKSTSSTRGSKLASSSPAFSSASQRVDPPIKAASTSSFPRGLRTSPNSSTSSSLSVDEQFAALKMASSRPNNIAKESREAQQPHPQRAMLTSLRSSPRIPKKTFDERKAAADAAHLAWSPSSPRPQKFPAVRPSSPNTSIHTSKSPPPPASTQSKYVYTKPIGFKAPVIHAPERRSTTPIKQSASSVTSQKNGTASSQPARKPGKVVVEKRTVVNGSAKLSKPVTTKPRINTATTAKPKGNVASNNTALSNSTTQNPVNKSNTSSPTNSEYSDEIADEELSDEDAWLKKARATVDKIKGIDPAAADSIFNDVVVKGDPVVWEDIAGLDKAKGSLKEAVVYPFLRPDLFSGLREPAQGMLLFGPPGTGKTMLARAVATESKSTFFSISASSLTSKFLGESEKLVRALFLMAKALSPSIIFVDEIDSLLSARSDAGEHESSRRIKTEFLIQWSALQHAAAGKEHDDVSRVLVLAATNLPWVIDDAARRRFVRRQYIPLPEPATRRYHLKKLLSRQKHSLSLLDMERLVRLTDGFSGSDLTALAKDAAMGPLRSLGDALLTTPTEKIRPLNFHDFQASLKTIRPSVSKDSLKVFEDWASMYGSSGA